jgi:tmRNA-binding protein
VAKDKIAEGEKMIVKNRRAVFDYFIEEHYEGGLVLVGSEVKSMREGKVDIVDAFASVERDGLYLKQLYVAPAAQGASPRQGDRRDRQRDQPRRLHAHSAPALLQERTREGGAGPREGKKVLRQAP